MVAAADRVTRELGGANILINNAGVMLLAAFTSDQRTEMRQMVEVNLMGAITATESSSTNCEAAEGDLVNISSVAGRTARAGNAVYAATKWGINGWSEALRQESLPDIRVIVIEPGAVATELTDHITDPHAKQSARQFSEIAINAEDIAEIITFAVTRPRRVCQSTRSWSVRQHKPADDKARGRRISWLGPSAISTPRAHVPARGAALDQMSKYRQNSYGCGRRRIGVDLVLAACS